MGIMEKKKENGNYSLGSRVNMDRGIQKGGPMASLQCSRHLKECPN